MLLAQGNKISFRYEGVEEDLLKEISFFVNNATKAGIVGKNGCGKTTLFQIIRGDIAGFKGDLSFKEKISIGHLPQEVRFNEIITGMEYLWSVKDGLWLVNEKITQIGKGNQDDYDVNIFSEYEDQGGYDFEIKLKKLAPHFSFSEEILTRPISTLSGGEKTRLALFRIILTVPDLLLLDEPTNHLDIKTLNWLETYLKDTEIPFLIISHDRRFLDKCVNQIWEIENKNLRVFSGNYSFFKEEKEIEFNIKLQEYEKQQKKIKQLEKAVEERRLVANKMENFKLSRSIAKNGRICKKDEGSGSGKSDPTKKMRSAKVLEKRMEMIIDKKKSVVPYKEKERKLIFKSSDQSRSKIVLSVLNLRKSYGDELFPPVNLEIERGSRVALIGQNGCGKSTILKIITGYECPTSGEVYFPPSVCWSYYSQEYENLNLERRIIDEVLENNKDNHTLARTILASVGLEGDKVFQKIETLSMGERSKVAIVKTIVNGANVLILDEPTNHLEIRAKELIETALLNYDGTIIFVSHDRMFMEKLANRIFDVETGEYFSCSYQEYVKAKE